jgi:hypothetical protein
MKSLSFISPVEESGSVLAEAVGGGEGGGGISISCQVMLMMWTYTQTEGTLFWSGQSFIIIIVS